MKNTQPTREELEAVDNRKFAMVRNSKHCKYLGINLFKIFTYELIQILNHNVSKQKD